MQTIKVFDTETQKRKCNITFILGNGFDLNLGMDTRYSDMYKGYIEQTSIIGYIDKFKKHLNDQAPIFEKWGDFEMAMAEYAKILSSEEEFVGCVRDFKGYMVRYLTDENHKMVELIKNTQNTKEILSELDKSLTKFYDGLTPNDKNQIKSIIEKADVARHYITFNYTTPLETLLAIKARDQVFWEREPIHIHGKLGGDIVLGVDYEDQLMGIKFDLTKKGERAFIKPLFNEQFDKARVDTTKNIILESSIICVYGFAMGESDNTWVWLLGDWLLANKQHHLIYYDYNSPKLDSYNSDEIMEVEEELKFALWKKLGLEENSVLDQIHIPVGRNLFNFNFKEIVPHILKPSEFNPLDTYETTALAVKE